MKVLPLLLCLLTATAWADVGGVVTAGKLKLALKDAWIVDSSTSFVRILAVPYAAPDHKLVKGQPRVELCVWCTGPLTQANLNMARVDIYDAKETAYKYSWTKPADARGAVSTLARQGATVKLTSRVEGAHPETGDVTGSWDLRLNAIK